MTPEQESNLIRTLHSAGATEEQIIGALRKSRGEAAPAAGNFAPPPGTPVEAGTLFPGGENILNMAGEVARNPTLRNVGGMVLPVAGAILGGQVGQEAGEAIPVAQGAARVAKIVRGAMPYVRGGLQSIGEGLGLGGGIVANQYASGQPIDVGAAVGPARTQALAAAGMAGGGYLLGRAGGVAPDAAGEAVGRPSYVKRLPRDAHDLLSRDIIKTVEETPLSPGRAKLNDMIASHDLNGKYVDGEAILTAMEKARQPGSSAEAMFANDRLKKDIDNLRAEMHAESQKLQTPPITRAGAPGLFAPEVRRPVPGVEIPPVAPTMIQSHQIGAYGGTTPPPPLTMQGAPETFLGGGRAPGVPSGTPYDQMPHNPTAGAATYVSGARIEGTPPGLVPPHLQTAYGERPQVPLSTMAGAPGVSIPPGPDVVTPPMVVPPVQPDVVPPHLQNAYGQTVPPPGAENMRIPLTATKADAIIQRSLTKPVRAELQGQIGGGAYGGAREAARNYAAQAFYEQLGPGAKEAGAAANLYLKPKEKLEKYIAADEFGDPRLSTPGRIKSMGAPSNPSAETLMKKVREYDAATKGNPGYGTMEQKILDLNRKSEWGSNEVRSAGQVSSILQPGRASIRETGDLRVFIRQIARLLIRGQGKVGAAGRAAFIAPVNGQVKKKEGE